MTVTQASVQATRNPGHSPDELERMSIVVQGGLYAANVNDVARNCRHWRSLFPGAEIILAISSTDLLRAPDPGMLSRLEPAAGCRDDTGVAGPLAILEQVCDVTVLARPALTLPPIKTDTDRPNNINLQIAAARAGLEVATRHYTLRVRNDLTLRDPDFLTQYRVGQALPRGAASAFRERVLISSVYTVNPFSYERLPFHYGDWFNLGLTEDVQAMWLCDEMSLRDAGFHDGHPPRRASSSHERLFRLRLAVEQHLAIRYVSAAFPDAKLDEHNDLRSIDLSIDFLCDNFVICDLAAAHCDLPRYMRELADPFRIEHCFTAGGWRQLVDAAAADRPRIAAALAPPATAWERPFPRYFPAASLSLPGRESWEREICRSPADGEIFFGPYDALPPGDYVARVDTILLQGPGLITLRATAARGLVLLGETKVAVAIEGTVLEIAFTVAPPGMQDVEIVAIASNLRAICIAGIGFERREAVLRVRGPLGEGHIIRRWSSSDNPPPRRSPRRVTRWLSRRLTLAATWLDR